MKKAVSVFLVILFTLLNGCVSQNEMTSFSSSYTADNISSDSDLLMVQVKNLEKLCKVWGFTRVYPVIRSHWLF